MSRGVAGRTVLLTRDEGLADEVRALGAKVILVEPLRYEALPAEVALSDFDWIIFTSRRAVAFLGAPLGGAPPIACVGSATAAEVERRGGEAALVPDRSDAESLARALIERAPASGLRVLFPCSERSLGTIEGLLGRAGAEVTRLPVYRPVAAKSIPAAAASAADVTVFLAPSAVEAFAELGGDLGAAPALAIGATTAAALRARGVEPVIAPTSDRAGILEALREWEWDA